MKMHVITTHKVASFPGPGPGLGTRLPTKIVWDRDHSISILEPIKLELDVSSCVGSVLS